MARIAINGFGRIGRLFFREAFEKSNMEVIAINDLGDVNNLAYLLKYDTVYRTWNHKVSVSNGNLMVDDKEVKVLQIKDPSLIPWKDLNIDIVLESTGVFESFEKAKAHLDAGAKKVIITAPAKDAECDYGRTVLAGVNDVEAYEYPVLSNGSCTTNAAHPVIAALAESIGIEKAVLNTVHAYTATQGIVDGPTRGSDFRRGRAAAQNIVPSTTGAAISVTRAIASLVGKFDGISLRVPTVTGSIVDITFIASRLVTESEVNAALKSASETERWKGILTMADDQLVSSDIIGMTEAAIVDPQFTKVVGGNLVKVLAWYDNEAGYVSTLLRKVDLLSVKL